MARNTRVLVGLLLASTVPLVAAPPAADATRTSNALPLVDWNCLSAGQVRPTHIVLACGDGNAVAEHVVWKRWTDKGAAGVGVLHQNGCVPDCADGSFHDYPATFRLSEKVSVGGRPYFTRVTISFAGASPVHRRSEVVKDCFDNPPSAHIPRCPADLQA